MSRYDRLVKWIGPLLRFFFPVREICRPETLPEEGIVVCGNHISFFDPLFLAVSLPRNITFMGKEELLKRPIIGKWVQECEMIPLSRDGGDAVKLMQAVRALKSKKLLAIFPQGKRCRYPLQKEDFKTGAGMMVALSGAKVLPVGFYSKNYKVRLFRKTYVYYGDLISIPFSQDLGKKEQSAEVMNVIYDEISRVEELARKAYEAK